MNNHLCIKCNTPYQDKDPEPYYCSSCLKEKKEIAEKIDSQFKSRPRKQYMSPLQAYDNTPVGKFFKNRSNSRNITFKRQ